MSEYTHRDYAATHDAPAGYEWTGEYREPTNGVWYLSNRGSAHRSFIKRSANREPHGNTGYERHLLRKLRVPGSGEFTHPGYVEAGYAAPSGYEFTGEFRNPFIGDEFLSDQGEVILAKNAYLWATSKRHILHKVVAPVVTPVDAAWATGVSAPAGFEYAGEFRPVKRFDCFLKKDGTAGVGQYAGEGTSPRHILKSATTYEEEYPSYKWRGEHPLHGQLGEPPKGYEFTGEFREPAKGEKFACNGLPHSPRTGPVFPSAKLRESRRWILRRLPPELPAVSGVTVAVNRNGGVPFPITLDDYLFTAAEARLIAERLTDAAAYVEQR